MHFQRLTVLVVAVALAAPVSLLAETRSRQRTGMAQAVVDAMNVERAAHGLPALRIDEKLSIAASDRIYDMFDKHYFAHRSPDGIQPWNWVELRGYNYREVGENLAVGYETAEGVVDSWMHSPGHRANVLKRAFDDVGVAVAAESPKRPFRGPTVVAIYGVR
jgi:uncharacterized protein YkwD